MREGWRATIFGIGGSAGGPLMWGLERLGVSVPPWVAFAVVVGSAALILLAIIMCAHMAAVWLRSRGRRKVGQALIASIGIIFVIVGTSAVAYAILRFGPEQSALGNSSLESGTPPIGGRGGHATVEGNRSGGIGGDAGESGVVPGIGVVLGGPGGDVAVKGDRSFARGGAGSNAPQPDGRGGRHTKS